MSLPLPTRSRLHPEYGEELLPSCPLPAVLRLSGKMELLDRLLLKLRATGGGRGAEGGWR